MEPRIWPLGHLHLALPALRGYKVLDTLASYHKKLKADTMYLCLPFQPPLVFTIDPATVKYILKENFDNYPKGPTLHGRMGDLLGDGIFNVDGALWHSQRKISSKMFTANKFKNHIWKVVDKNTAKVITLLKQTGPDEVVDMFNLLNRFTLDSIGEIGFGAEIGSIETPSSPFLHSFDKAQQIILYRFVIPCWQVMRFFGLLTEWSTYKHFNLLKSYAKDIVKKLKKNLNKEAGDSFVGLFIKNGEQCTNDLLADLVLNFLIAGRDTTAQAMSWCLYNIMLHPEVEKKILEEGDEVCGDGRINYEQLNKLEYLHAVIAESLRLYPSVPMDLKEVKEDDTLPNGTWVSKGSMVIYSAYSMGRSEKIWGPDAEEFRPERWLELERAPDAYHFPAFHAGPRECLGKRLAQVEMKTALLSLLRKFKFELAVSPDKIRPDLQLTIGMSSGLPCHIRPRKDWRKAQQQAQQAQQAQQL